MNSDVQKYIEKCDLLWTNDHEVEAIKILLARSSSGTTTIELALRLQALLALGKWLGVYDRIMATKPNAFLIIKDLHTGGERKTYKKITEHNDNIPMTVKICY